MLGEPCLGIGNLLLLLGDLGLELVDVRLDLVQLRGGVLALGLGNLELLGKVVELGLGIGELARELLGGRGLGDGGKRSAPRQKAGERNGADGASDSVGTVDLHIEPRVCDSRRLH